SRASGAQLHFPPLPSAEALGYLQLPLWGRFLSPTCMRFLYLFLHARYAESLRRLKAPFRISVRSSFSQALQVLRCQQRVPAAQPCKISPGGASRYYLAERFSAGALGKMN